MRRNLSWDAHGLTAVAAAVLAAPAGAQDAANGAMLYMRLPADVRACVSCHGPDPGQNHNNILRAADSPATLTRVLNTVSAMGFLRSRLADGEIADITAFLGTVARLNAAESALRLWPVTLEFGSLAVGDASAGQVLRLHNPLTTALLPVTSITSSDAAVALSHDCPAALPPSASCNIRAVMTAGAAGLHCVAVQVRTPSQTAMAGASGFGSRDPLGRLRWRAEPGALTFTASQAGSALRRTLVLENVGVMPVVLGQASLTGPQATQFRRESGCDSGSVLQAGTACEMVVAYTASQLPQAQAVLQMRGDGGNPASVALQGTLDTQASPQPAPVLPMESGGGCSTRPPGRSGDASLALLALAAAALAWLRRPRSF